MTAGMTVALKVEWSVEKTVVQMVGLKAVLTDMKKVERTAA